MELKELTEKTFEIFNCKTTTELSNVIFEIVKKNDIEYYKKFENLVSDLSVDWLQMIFQYYEADRKEKMQDYTPLSLAKFCGKLTDSDGEKVVYDMCAGSGALTIQKWNLNKKLYFICHEFDKNVIPYLIFNLAIRNITANVIHGDVLSGETFATYSVVSGDKYSTVSKVEETNITADSCISNPPYNMAWEVPLFAQLESRFANCELPPKGNANYAFVLTAIDKIKSMASLLLPCGVLTGKEKSEIAIKKYLIEKNLIDAIILNPDKMFEKTGIATCFLVINKHKNTANIALLDMRNTFEIEKREQNGQFGGASHTNRTYTKELKIYTDEQIQKAIDCIKNKTDIKDFCKIVSIQDISEKNYNLLPTAYFEIDFNQETKHREYSEIIDDINRVIAEKNKLKLTINETIARNLGLTAIYELSKENERIQEEMNNSLKFTGKKIESECYIALSKNAGEFKFENKSKKELSTIIISIFQMWKQHIIFMNNEENRYLAELRDALLPDLMSGKIEL